jgi:hypothetical protein
MGLDMDDMVDRLVENFTARQLLGMLDHEMIGHLYDTAARLMEWEDDEDE